MTILPMEQPKRSKGRLVGPALLAAAAGAAIVSQPLTKSSEGKRNVAYMDRIARKPTPTTCFGHTGPEVKVGHYYTDWECSVLLEGDQTIAAVGVYKCGPDSLADHPKVWAALTDAAFNLGVRTVCNSSMMKLSRLGDYYGACGRFQYYHKPPVPGIIKRRANEAALCYRGV